MILSNSDFILFLTWSDNIIFFFYKILGFSWDLKIERSSISSFFFLDIIVFWVLQEKRIAKERKKINPLLSHFSWFISLSTFLNLISFLIDPSAYFTETLEFLPYVLSDLIGFVFSTADVLFPVNKDLDSSLFVW